ncbi:MAG TPA: hypothetical protein VMF53_01040 [Alphaproteobacteria bacterium]|nr:hypothetical protein [Alphaproteobacteria bacterium]
MGDQNNSGTSEKLKAADGEKGKRQRSSIAFPYMDLSEALNLAKAVFENVATGPCTVEQLAPWVKQSPTSSAFRNRMGAAKLFGVIDAERSDAIHLTEIGRMVVDQKREREGKAKAFLSVPLFSAIHDKFKGAALPPTAALEKELVALGVADTLKDTARRVFERSAEQAGFFEAGRDRLVLPGFVPTNGKPTEPEKPRGGGASGGGGIGSGADDPLIGALIQKLPKSGETWPIEARITWLQLVSMAFQMAYGQADEIEIKKAGVKP